MPDPELVELVRRAWAEALDTDAVPLDLNFFDAGGDSVLLIVLMERLNELTDRTLEPPDLFRHSTVLAQAELLSGADTPAAVPDGAVQPDGVRPPDRSALLGRARVADA